ncbi:CheR family methyltransferase [Garciella nitratireducens]|uniref:CheR family methyltransferase n=1 Tax=Garciella nitratireducens TaxID=218205 RepID=UPI001BD1BD4F|nr:protein-glutamate O-methyltransferase CheR [Garciella nitratireducens]
MEQDFQFFEQWAYKNLSIDLTAYKPTQLHRRILTIMKRAGYKNLKEYAKAIDENEKIKIQFLDYITINVTEFFRNKEMFFNLQKKIEFYLLNEFSSLKIWSAACSIGAEPYSLAIILDKISKENDHKILATDIDDSILQRAKQGIYTWNEVKNVDPQDRITYFDQRQGKFFLKEDIKKKVNFKKHDLILDPYDKGFHLIVCRNVIIYFKNKTKDKIYKKFYESLVPGGFLFVGATETIFNYKDLGFEKVSTFLYQKQR